MDIFVDTSNNDLYIAIFWNGKVYKKIHIENLKKKHEILIGEFTRLISGEKGLIDSVKRYYINVGPGSFTGARQGLAYFITFARVLGKAVFYGNTFDILKTIYPNENYLYLNAYGNKSFVFDKNRKQIYTTDNANLPVGFSWTQIDYKLVEKNINKIISLFKPTTDAQIVEPSYLKDPQIGSKK